MLPERRQGPPPGHRPDASTRLMFGLNILADKVQRRRARQGSDEVLEALSRHDGVASTGVLGERARLGGDELASTLEELEEAGLVEQATLGSSAQAARLTQAGAARVEVFRAEHKTADEEFLAPLSPEDREQLDVLLRKLFR